MEEGVNEAVEAVENEANAEETSWHNVFGEDVTDEIRNFKSPGEFAKGYTNLKSKLGNNIKPPDFTTDEGIDAWRKDIGLESADAYEFPETAADEKLDKDFLRDLAFRKGIPKEVASDIYKELAEREISIEKQIEEAANKHRGELEKELGLKWGKEKDNNIAMAEKAIDALNVSKESKAWLKENIGSDIRGIEAFHFIGSKMSESSLGDLEVSKQTMSAEDAKKEIATIRNDPNHAYHSDNYNIRKTAIEHMENLYRIAGMK